MQHREGPCPELFAPGHWYGDRTYKHFLQHDERAFSPSEERDSKAKVDFIEASIRHEHNFENDNPTDPEICGIVNWLAGRSAEQVGMLLSYVAFAGALVLARSMHTGNL